MSNEVNVLTATLLENTKQKAYAQGVADERARIEAEIENVRALGVVHSQKTKSLGVLYSEAMIRVCDEILRRIRDKERPT